MLTSYKCREIREKRTEKKHGYVKRCKNVSQFDKMHLAYAKNHVGIVLFNENTAKLTYKNNIT